MSGLTLLLFVSVVIRCAALVWSIVLVRRYRDWRMATLTGMLILLGAILAFEVLVSHRWFCRTLCPGGALLGLIWLVCVLLVLLSREARARLTRRAVAAWLAFPAMVAVVALHLDLFAVLCNRKDGCQITINSALISSKI